MGKERVKLGTGDESDAEEERRWQWEEVRRGRLRWV